MYKKHENEWVEIITQILEGLRYIHETHDIIHRDIKPGNIWIKRRVKIKDQEIKVKLENQKYSWNFDNSDSAYSSDSNDFSFNYQIKIWDFGLSKKSSKGIFDWTNETGGTRLFQAPEQAMSLSYGKPVDVWAVGIIMYYLLSFGKHPISLKGYSVNNGNHSQTN